MDEPEKSASKRIRDNCCYKQYFLIRVTCKLNATRKANMKRKYMNTDKAQLKKPKLRTLTSEVCGGTNVQSKQAHVLQYKS